MAPHSKYEMEPSRESVVQTAAAVTEPAEKLVGAIGQTMDSAAQTIQNTFRRTRKSAGAAMGTVADGLDTSAEYHVDRGVVRVVEDVETLIRRHPFQALILGVSVGYLLSRPWQR